MSPSHIRPWEKKKYSIFVSVSSVTQIRALAHGKSESKWSIKTESICTVLICLLLSTYYILSIKLSSGETITHVLCL